MGLGSGGKGSPGGKSGGDAGESESGKLPHENILLRFAISTERKSIPRS
jgi:hypothetical protein